MTLHASRFQSFYDVSRFCGTWLAQKYWPCAEKGRAPCAYSSSLVYLGSDLVAIKCGYLPSQVDTSSNPSHSSAAAKYRGFCETLCQHFGACWPTSRQHVVQNFRVRQGKPGVGHRRRRRRLRSVHHDSLRQASEAGLATGVVQGSRALVAYREHATTGRMVMMIELPKYILSSSTAGLMRRSTC